MRFQLIKNHRGEFPVTCMCEVLNMSPSGYYTWRGRPASARGMANRELVKKIEAVYHDNYGTYGSPRIYRELKAQGVACADRPDQKWLSDITYIPTLEGWLYLAVILDLYARRIVGWAMSDRMISALTVDALQMAIRHRQPGPGLIHHSDQGSQYTNQAYQTLLKKTRPPSQHEQRR